MDIQSALDILNSHFKYQTETSKMEKWRILGDGNWKGDCEDYSLTLMWLISDSQTWKFWWGILSIKFLMWMVLAPSGETHAIVRIGGLYYDNIQKRGCTKEELIRKGYKFKYPMIAPYVFLKMLISKFA